jgi:hypothetical protein
MEAAVASTVGVGNARSCTLRRARKRTVSTTQHQSHSALASLWTAIRLSDSAAHARTVERTSLLLESAHGPP